MKNSNDISVSRLSDLPIFKTVTSYKPSDFDAMTKQELIDLLSSAACISWSKPKILQEVNRAYDAAKRYFDKYGKNLSQLEAGQLCLKSDKLDTCWSEKPIYILIDLYWKYWGKDNYVLCRLQKFAIQTSYDECRTKSLSCRIISCGYHDEEAIIYPVPQDISIMNAEAVKNFKKALDSINPVNSL
jgi:hypothetical protein